jgi:hypothetical protein
LENCPRRFWIEVWREQYPTVSNYNGLLFVFIETVRDVEYACVCVCVLVSVVGRRSGVG